MILAPKCTNHIDLVFWFHSLELLIFTIILIDRSWIMVGPQVYLQF